MIDGLRDRDRKAILEVLCQHPKTERVVLFGSRAMGTYTATSDVDIALYGDLTMQDQSLLSEKLYSLTIPYKVDLVRMKAITSPELLKHIKTYGREWLTKEIYVSEQQVEGYCSLSVDMGAKWKLVTIANIAKRVAMGPFGSNIKADNFVAKGVPVIRGGNLTDGRFNGNNFVFLTEQKADELVTANAFPNDIIFTHRGTLGQVGIIPEGKYPRYVVSQSQMKLTCNTHLAYPLFIYYFFKSPAGQHALLMNTSQTGVPAISRPVTSLKQIQIPLPPLPTQRRIAHILGTLDDKIELNRKMNQTLEEMARALFKSWFIDFDPVHRNIARAKKTLDEKIDKKHREYDRLFPDSFVDSELGKIPKGWEVKSLDDIVNIFDSKRIPLSGKERESRKGIYPYYGAASIMDYIDDYLFDGVYVLMGEDGSVINSDKTPVIQYAWGRFWVNNHAHVLQGKAGISTEQLMMYLKNTNIKPFLTGAVQLKLNQKNLKQIPITFATAEINQLFYIKTKPLFTQLRYNANQIKSLAEMRDSLLPKLLNGELNVVDLECHKEISLC